MLMVYIILTAMLEDSEHCCVGRLLFTLINALAIQVGTLIDTSLLDTN